MKTLAFDESFDRDFVRLPRHIQERVDKQLALLLSNPYHRSLRLKKMNGWPDIWEGSVSRDYRFTFKIVGDTYRLRHVGPHDILRHP